MRSPSQHPNLSMGLRLSRRGDLCVQAIECVLMRQNWYTNNKMHTFVGVHAFVFFKYISEDKF